MSGKRIKVFISEEDGEHLIEIGDGSYEQNANGDLDVKLWMIGDYTMSSRNVSGSAQIRGFIPASLRKD